MIDFFLSRFCMILYFSENKVFFKWSISESSLRHILISLSLMILYKLEGHIKKMRIIIRYFFLKISIHSCQSLTNTRKKIDKNFAHFFYLTLNESGYFEKMWTYFKPLIDFLKRNYIHDRFFFKQILHDSVFFWK